MTKVKNPKISPHNSIVSGILYLFKTDEVPGDGDLYHNEDGDYFVCHSLRNNLKIGFPGDPFKVLPYVISETEDILVEDTIVYNYQLWKVAEVFPNNDLMIYNPKFGIQQPGQNTLIEGDEKKKCAKVLVYPNQFNREVLNYITSKELIEFDKIDVRCNEVKNSENEFEITITPGGSAIMVFSPRKNTNPYKKNSFESIAYNYCVSKNIPTKLVNHFSLFAKSDEIRKFWYELFRTGIH